MKASLNAVKLIQSFEGLELKAYVDPASGGEPISIGYGTTIYPDGRKVKLGDKCTKEQAEQYLAHDIDKFAVGVNRVVVSKVNQNQFDALVSFAYNVGLGNLKSSTLLKKVNANPNDLTIKKEFAKWNKAAGKVMNGLVRRRAAESALYFII